MDLVMETCLIEINKKLIINNVYKFNRIFSVGQFKLNLYRIAGIGFETNIGKWI